jgi:hypothetical protein
VTHSDVKPTTHQRNLAKLPLALMPLIERRQWAIWRWTQKPDGKWQKPPFMATEPERHASTNDPGTWADYATALAAVQAGHGDGLSYVLTKDDPLGAIDLDHCRDKLCSIDVWAQNFMQAAVDTYQEVTPSGEGIRIWGLAAGDPLNSKYTLEFGGKQVAAELFRRTKKALTITGYTLNPSIREFTNIDRVFSWAVVWGERRKAEMIKATAPTNGNGFDSGGCKYSIDEIERIVREGAPAGSNRSDLFHTIVGHYVGCGWRPERILVHLQQYPDGIGKRYSGEDRLGQEVHRSAGKYAKAEPELPLSDGNIGWTAREMPEPEAPAQEKKPRPWIDPKPHQPDPDIIEDEDDVVDDEDPGEPGPDPNLPQLYAHGDADDRPLRAWLIKHLIPQVGHGLMSGQWGVGKTFAFYDLAASLNTGQPWLGHVVKRQCGALLIAAEGADEVRLRLDAVVREKCGNLTRAPFYWYETGPLLLHKDAVEKLIAMARQAEASLEEEFGLPLGLIGIDTIAACAGYARAGDEYDNAVGQAIMNLLKAVAQELKCFVLGIDHFGKSLEAGTRGASSKEASADVVLACLGDKQLSGSVTNTRLAVRKHRGGKQGQEYPFTLRLVEAPEPDEDGDKVTTMVVDWLPPGTAQATAPPDDPWALACRQQDQRTAMLRLKRVIMTILAERGIDLPIPPDGPVVRMVDQEIVREVFYGCTPAEDGQTPKQQRQLRHTQFKRARDRAEQNGLIGVGNTGKVTYLWLTRPDGEKDDD